MAPGREGDAWGIEARVNSRETMNTDNEWVGGAWYRRTDDNYSVARRDPGVDTTEYGLELTGSLSPRIDFSARASVVERENLDEDRRLSLQADYALTGRSTVSGELRSVDEKHLGNSANGTLLALRRRLASWKYANCHSCCLCGGDAPPAHISRRQTLRTIPQSLERMALRGGVHLTSPQPDWLIAES